MAFVFPNSSLPFWLAVVLAGLGLIAFGLRMLERLRRKRLAQFVEASLAPRLLGGYRAAVRRPLSALALAGFALLAATFAQPHWGQAWEEVHRASRDVVIVLDTSESMRAANPLPSRIERAKQEISSLLDYAPGDRFGLIAFSGAAALQCPLTLDHAYFRAVLNAVDTNTISREGTDIAAALQEAVKLFEDEQSRTTDSDRNARAVLLISDGEQVAGDAVKKGEDLSKYARVFVIGVGNPEGSVIRAPDWMGPYSRQLDGGQTHVSMLDEDTLMRIASVGNGAYVRSEADNWDIDQIYDRFKSLASRDVSSDVRYRLVNRYQWFLAAAILCFMGEGVWLVLMPWLRTLRLWREARAGERAPLEERQHA